MKKISQINDQKSIGDTKFTDINLHNDSEQYLQRLMPFNPDASVFTLTCRREDYSAGRISRAIEDCDANVLNLNVTSDTTDGDELMVEVRIDRKNIESVIRSLARYHYYVEGVDDIENAFGERDRERVAELLRQIDI